MLQGRGVSGQLLFRYLKKHSVGSEKNVGLVDPKHIQRERERERERSWEKEREKDGVPKRDLRGVKHAKFLVFYTFFGPRDFLLLREKSTKISFGVLRKTEREKIGGKIPRRKKTKKVCYHDSFMILVLWCCVHLCKFPSPRCKFHGLWEM